eukprot:scaffold124437_cov24-Tisochrysis_lutea.AAC.4
MMREVIMEQRPSATTEIITPTWEMRDVMGAAMEASASHKLTPTRAPAYAHASRSKHMQGISPVQ